MSFLIFSSSNLTLSLLIEVPVQKRLLFFSSANLILSLFIEVPVQKRL